MPVSAELKPALPGSAGSGLTAEALPGQAAGKPQSGAAHAADAVSAAGAGVQAEKGGPAGPEPTRYGDWEHAGRCIDF
jgi:hypothetical protein